MLGNDAPRYDDKAKAQELYRPSEVIAPQRMSSPSNARNTIMIPQFQKKFEQVAKATMQKIPRARVRCMGRIVPSQRAGQSPIRKDRQ